MDVPQTFDTPTSSVPGTKQKLGTRNPVEHTKFQQKPLNKHELIMDRAVTEPPWRSELHDGVALYLKFVIDAKLEGYLRCCMKGPISGHWFVFCDTTTA